MFLTQAKNIFWFRVAKFVSATYVSRATILGNIRLRNNVSQFSQAFTLLFVVEVLTFVYDKPTF